MSDNLSVHARRPRRRTRPPDLGAAQRSHARAGVPEAGVELDRPALPVRADVHRLGHEDQAASTRTKKELVKDFRTAIEFDQSALFKKVYEEEFGTFGGAPFGTLIGDFEISRQPEDMYFVEQMCARRGRRARAVHLGRVAGAVRPRVLPATSASRATCPRCSTPSTTPSGARSASRRIRATSASTLPRFLGRLPFNPKDGTAVERLQLRRGRRRHRPLEVPVGQRRLRDGRAS